MARTPPSTGLGAALCILGAMMPTSATATITSSTNTTTPADTSTLALLVNDRRERLIRGRVCVGGGRGACMQSCDRFLYLNSFSPYLTVPSFPKSLRALSPVRRRRSAFRGITRVSALLFDDGYTHSYYVRTPCFRSGKKKEGWGGCLGGMEWFGSKKRRWVSRPSTPRVSRPEAPDQYAPPNDLLAIESVKFSLLCCHPHAFPRA